MTKLDELERQMASPGVSRPAINTLKELEKVGADPLAMAVRILSKARVTDGGCWVIDTNHNKAGYAIIRLYRRHERPKNLRAHRALYEILNGPIAHAMVVDHKCRNRACCNLSHLRVVTQKQNSIENSTGWSARNKAKTHCYRGHPLSGDNLRSLPDGNRACIACNRALTRESDLRRKERLHASRMPFTEKQP